MRRFIFPILLSLFGCQGYLSKHDEKRAYVLYDSKGETTYKNLLDDAKNSDVILFGELHNNPISHWLQLELAKDLYSVDLVLGAEMFEADTQRTIDDYMDGEIEEEEFIEASRAWPNYATDYAPLVNYAKEHKLPFIATNIPRRYAKLVNKEGLEALDDLTDEEKIWMAPLPIEFDPEIYREMLDMDHGGKNLQEAQAVKDATMAYFISLYPGRLIHLNGDYHTEGIAWYLRNNDITILTIKTAEDRTGQADYVIVVDKDMTKTY